MYDRAFTPGVLSNAQSNVPRSFEHDSTATEMQLKANAKIANCLIFCEYFPAFD